eukprot:c2553_g1_i1.p1 GENE.c2553_g1_i1~~c2553_g1_i1.p1  ORF type:complete len:598 (-),score=140.42 c2553_g1_i1:13-1779(-)
MLNSNDTSGLRNRNIQDLQGTKRNHELNRVLQAAEKTTGRVAGFPSPTTLSAVSTPPTPKFSLHDSAVKADILQPLSDDSTTECQCCFNSKCVVNWKLVTHALILVFSTLKIINISDTHNSFLRYQRDTLTHFFAPDDVSINNPNQFNDTIASLITTHSTLRNRSVDKLEPQYEPNHPNSIKMSVKYLSGLSVVMYINQTDPLSFYNRYPTAESFFDNLERVDVTLIVYTFNVKTDLCVEWTIFVKYMYALQGYLHTSIDFNTDVCKGESEYQDIDWWYNIMLVCLTILSTLMSFRSLMRNFRDLRVELPPAISKKTDAVLRNDDSDNSNDSNDSHDGSNDDESEDNESNDNDNDGPPGGWIHKISRQGLRRLKIFSSFFFISMASNLSNLSAAIWALIHPNIILSDHRYPILLLIGLGCIFACANMLRYLGYRPRFYILTLTVENSVADSLGVLVTGFPVFIGSSLLGMMVFGYVAEHYATVGSAAATQTSLMNGDSVLAMFTMSGRWGGSHIGHFFMFSWVIFAIAVLFRTLTAVFVMKFVRAKSQVEALEKDRVRFGANQELGIRVLKESVERRVAESVRELVAV